ncbi:MAG: creatininase family protein [Planctomycetota bacterium]|nr:creatininase family protein [Planctomycetota bacterium]
MEGHPWRLEEATLADIRWQPYEAAVLPFGATECHNLHLPYGTDTIEVSRIADGACEFAWRKGAKVALLPTVPYGADRNLLGFPMVINLDQRILDAIVEGTVESLEKHGVRKLVILNGHGGNEFAPCLRTLHGKTGVFVSLCDWWRMIDDKVREICANPDDHGGEMETSLMKLLAPELVRMERADHGAARNPRLKGLARGWIKMARPFHLMTDNCGSGNPELATAEKGKRLYEVAVERLGSYLVELCAAKMDASFPY